MFCRRQRFLFLGCSKPGKERCTGCRLFWYCSPSCQKDDWKTRHRHICAAHKVGHRPFFLHQYFSIRSLDNLSRRSSLQFQIEMLWVGGWGNVPRSPRWTPNLRAALQWHASNSWPHACCSTPPPSVPRGPPPPPPRCPPCRRHFSPNSHVWFGEMRQIFLFFPSISFH